MRRHASILRAEASRVKGTGWCPGWIRPAAFPPFGRGVRSPTVPTASPDPSPKGTEGGKANPTNGTLPGLGRYRVGDEPQGAQATDVDGRRQGAPAPELAHDGRRQQPQGLCFDRVERHDDGGARLLGQLPPGGEGGLYVLVREGRDGHRAEGGE